MVAVVRPDLPQTWAPLALAFLSVVALVRPVLRVTLDAAEVMELSARRRGLEERTQAARLEAEVRSGAEAGPLLREYVEEQATRWTERQRSGDLTEIRKAFERLSGLIHERRTASAGAKAASADEKPLAPLDRVIVYINDLDRCPPGQVVNVLSAINLLLDIPHFVVVVGVDSPVSTGRSSPGTAAGSPRAGWSAPAAGRQRRRAAPRTSPRASGTAGDSSRTWAHDHRCSGLAS